MSNLQVVGTNDAGYGHGEINISAASPSYGKPRFYVEVVSTEFQRTTLCVDAEQLLRTVRAAWQLVVPLEVDRKP